MTTADQHRYFAHVVAPPWRVRARRHVLDRRAWSAAADASALVPGTAAAVELARRQGFVLTSSQARSTGLSDADLRRLVRRGVWTNPRRGVLCVLPESEPGRPGGTDQRIAATAAALVRPELVISHRSAAVVRALPLLRWARRPELTIDRANGGGEPDLLVHAARVRPDEIDTWFGAPVLSVARTVTDVARAAGLAAGLVIADAALADELVTPADLVRSLARSTRWPGVRTARQAVNLASALSESPLESLSRLLVIEAELPVFDQQCWISTERGWFRVDGLWADRAVVLEADGLGKYDGRSALIEEKLRQEALERAGYLVVRVTWDDITRHRQPTVRRICDALRRGGRLAG